jgi:hypothetical protein
MSLPMASLRNVLGEGNPTRDQRIPAQVAASENQMSVLSIRRFRVRAPDAPLPLTWGYALDQDQIQVRLPMKKSAHGLPRFRSRRGPSAGENCRPDSQASDRT